MLIERVLPVELGVVKFPEWAMSPEWLADGVGITTGLELTSNAWRRCAVSNREFEAPLYVLLPGIRITFSSYRIDQDTGFIGRRHIVRSEVWRRWDPVWPGEGILLLSEVEEGLSVGQQEPEEKKVRERKAREVIREMKKGRLLIW